jgi:hypothetical protein
MVSSVGLVDMHDMAAMLGQGVDTHQRFSLQDLRVGGRHFEDFGE